MCIRDRLSDNHPKEFRKLWGGSSNNGENLIDYADPGNDYDMWQQAYRMLGGFIDCDHRKSEGSGDNGGGGSGDGDGDNQACSRWMMWASVSEERPNFLSCDRNRNQTGIVYRDFTSISIQLHSAVEIM